MMDEEGADCKLSAMTLNLRFGRADDGPNSWENRKERYVSFFQEYRPDFIGMQEANDFQIDFLKSLLQEYNCIGQRIPSPPYWQDNIIFFKKQWKCSSYERFFLSHTPTIPSRFADSKWPRQCVLGIFQKKRISVMCLNTHFDFLSSVQEQSAKIINQKLSSYHDSRIPVIITGDFNALPESPGYREFNTNGNLKEVFYGDYSGTYHGFTGEHSDRHIDWILYKGSMELLKKTKIIDQYQGGYLSDHFPVLAEFRISRNT
jgi:endonuclease/exonuclease/phosphatase family metal-dependent hydrolase